MKVITRTRHSLSIEIDGEEKELDLTHKPDGYDGVIEQHNEHVIVVGYLVQDSDCANPLENCDGMGHIHSLSRRHSNHMDADEAQSKLESDPFVVPLSYFEHGQCLWGVAGTMSGMPDFRWDGVNFAGIWVPDKCCVEHINSSAIKGLLPDGVKVEYKSKLNADGTVKLLPDGSTDPRYFNVITLTMPNGTDIGGFASFESAYRSACRRLGIKITRESRLRGQKQAALELAAQACEQYTAWCNGDCWGVCVDVFDAESGDKISNDACWGHVGGDYAMATLKDSVRRKCLPPANR